MHETFGIHGVITLHKIPDEWSDEDFRYWWCPITAPNGQILQPARISDQDKRNRIVMPPVENLITNNGIKYILTNMSLASTGSMIPFTQILSVGNGTISGVTRADTSVAGDGFGTNARKAPSSFVVTGFSTTVTTQYASGDAVGTITNIGFYGNGATTTAGSGTLATHALFNFVKGATAYAVNYTFLLSN